MIELGEAKGPIVVSTAFNGVGSGEKRASFRLLRRWYAHLASTLITAGILVAAIVLLGFALGMYPHVPAKSIKPTQVSTVKQVTPATGPHLIGAPAGNTNCANAQTANTVSFAACPSFLLDYSKQKKGLPSPNAFNVYTGEPVANNEAQLYTNNQKNLRVENGSLVLEAQNDPQQGFKYTSARIDTQNKADFLYGKFVIRATLPSGIGSWPAIWMLPSQPKYAGLSPASNTTRYLNDGELDIAEAIGSQPNTVYSVAHSLAYDDNGVDRTYFNTIVVPHNDTAFHDYEMDWTPTKLTFSIDGKAFYSYTKKPGATYQTWPFDQPFYLIINLALGGNWAGQDRADFPADGVDSSKLPAALKVQSIKYYSYIGPSN